MTRVLNPATDPRCLQVIELLREGQLNLGEIAARVDVSRKTLYFWMQRDDFRALVRATEAPLPLTPPDHRVCPVCGIAKRPERFIKSTGICQGCRKRELTTDRNRRIARIAKYGLTEAAFDDLFRQQDGKCAICKDADASVVDHDHDTGEVRGLLCRHCNMGLGFFRDRTEVLQGAIAYLKAS